LIPAAVATRAQISTLLSLAGRGSSGRHRLQGAIVISQLALGVLLAGCAGLLLRSYGALATVDAGFDPAHVVTFHVGAAWDEDRDRVAMMQERILAELQRLPGVKAAGFANFFPESGATLRSQVSVDGLSGTDPGGQLSVGERTVTPGYLQALAIPLVAGQRCSDLHAGPSTRQEVMVNRSFVDRLAGGQNVVGRSLTFNFEKSSRTIVGILGDVREDAAGSAPVPYVYACLPLGSWPDPEYVVRAEADPLALAGSIRQIVKSLDSSRPIFGLRPLTAVMEEGLDEPRLNARLLSSFAAAAVVLAALGLYGLLMLVVGERRREIGVRMALGATPMDVVETVVSGAGRLVAIGVLVGLGLTLGAGYLLRAVLFEVAPYDPRALAGGVLALACVAFVAVVMPARHAARINAIDAMRQ
jgi:predicted permease